MPLTAKGNEVLTAMKKRFGADKGEQVFYASRNAVAIAGVDAKVTTALQDGWVGGAFGTHENPFTDLAAFMQLLGDENAVNDGILLYDNIPLDDADAKVRFTDDGYLVANPRIARAGIQTYRGVECGKPEMQFVRVYRPPEEVFKSDATKSYAHRPVTIDHPDVPVTAANWREYAKGQTGGDILRDGNAVRVPMVLMDQSAIDAYKAGKNQLSVGYTCDLDWTAGAIDGQQYDAVQREIRANHLAVVTTARGGPSLVIGDNNGDDDMTTTAVLKMIMVDGINCQMTDTAAEIVNRYIAQLTQKFNDSTAQITKVTGDAAAQATKDATTITTLTTQMATKDAEIVTLKKLVEDAKVTPAMLDGYVKEIVSVSALAKHVMGDKASTLVLAGKTADEVRKQVVDARVGAVAKDWDAATVKISFDTMTAGLDPAKLSTGDNRSPILDTSAFLQPHIGTTDAQETVREKAHADYTATLKDAWMQPQPKVA